MSSSATVESTSTADVDDPVCPMCGGETTWMFAFTTGIDTYYEACLECDWRSAPE